MYPARQENRKLVDFTLTHRAYVDFLEVTRRSSATFPELQEHVIQRRSLRSSELQARLDAFQSAAEQIPVLSECLSSPVSHQCWIVMAYYREMFAR